MLRLYDYLDSGNGYKVRLLLHQLGMPFELVELDNLQGESRTPEYLEKNPNGKIPLLELADGTYLAESDAMLFYLAEGTRFLPDDRLGRAQVLQWMFFERYSRARRRGRALLADAPGDDGGPPRRARREVRSGPGGPRRHGEPSGEPPVFRRRRLFGRRHRALRLYPRSSGGRLRPRRLPGGRRLARAGPRPTRPRPDHRGLAAPGRRLTWEPP
jgi:hypothetical protein